jgi:hypothetical protein
LPRISLALIALVGAILIFLTVGQHHGQGQPAPLETKTIQLPAGQKLKSVSWACAHSGYCTPTYLTRPMRADELPETHTLRNEEGWYHTYVLSEHRSPTERDIR